MNTFLLEKILHTDSPSGNEKEIIDVIKANINPSAKIITDNLGNCIAYHGTTNDDYKVLIIAHCDEIGFQVVKIEDNGYIRFRPIGGVNPTYLPGSCITILNNNDKVTGCISYAPIHVQSKKKNFELDYNDLWIDIGTTTKEDTENYVDIGDYISLNNGLFHSADGNHLFAKGLDNKLGVYVLLEAFNALIQKDIPLSLYISATVQEELGCRGCKAVINKIRPDLVIVIDAGICGNIPTQIESKFGVVELGKGPGINYNPTNNINLNKIIENIAVENSIPYQRTVGYQTNRGTENAEIQTLLDGIITTHICIPVRNMHMSHEICNIKDIYSSIQLIIKTIECVSRIDNKEDVFIPW